MTTQLPPDDSAERLVRVAETFGLLSTVPRLRIVQALCEQELCVSQLTARVGLPQPGVSQQLGLLYRAGVVSRRRQGSQVYYRTESRTGALVCAAIRSLLH